MVCCERKLDNDDTWNWELAANSYNTEITLTNQPTGVKVNYQVRASNPAGTSCATNTVSVVL